MTVVSNLMLQIVTAICGFILPPLIVTSFGSTINGMVSSITQFIAYLNLVEAGIGAAAITALYKPLVNHENVQRNRILAATKRFYNRSGIIFTLLVIGLSIVYPLIIGTQVDKITAALMVLILGIAGAAEFFLIGKYRVLLTADKKIYVISFIQIFAVVANTAVAVFLIRVGANILVVKLCSAMIYLGRYVFLRIYVNKSYSDLDFTILPDTKAVSQSKNVLVHQISGLVVFNTPIVLITFFCSLKDASIYAVYLMIFTAINNLLGAFINGIQSFLGESLVKDSIEYTRKIFSKYETMFFYILGWVYNCTYMLIIPFMDLYTKNMSDAEYIQPQLAYLFLCSAIFKNLREPCMQLINAAGHFRNTQNRSIIEAVINIVFSFIFIHRIGMAGVLLGGIVSHLYRTSDVIIYSYKFILKQSALKTLPVLGVCFLSYIAISIIMNFFPVTISEYLEWICYAIICGIINILPVVMCMIVIKIGNKDI